MNTRCMLNHNFNNWEQLWSGQVLTCPQSDVLTKHGEIQCQRLRKSVSTWAMLIGNSWSVGSFQQNAVLYTTFGRLFEEFVGKYPKYDNIFQTTVDFSRNIKTIPKLTSVYENFS